VGINQAFDVTNILIYLTLGGIYMATLARLWKQLVPSYGSQSAVASSNFTITISAAMSVFFWYVLLGASTFHAWYLLWFLPLAALLVPRDRPTGAAVVVPLAALLVIPYYETVRVWFHLLLQNQVLGHIIGVSILLIPSMLAWFRPVDLLSYSLNDR
jgi:hypothetical protein